MKTITLTKKKIPKPQVVLAIDFDGVIHDKSNPIVNRKMGKPVDGAETAMMLLKLKGYRIIIHTVMANTEAGTKVVADWLKWYGVPYDEIVGKPQASFYIDDKALKFIRWTDTINEIEKGIS